MSANDYSVSPTEGSTRIPEIVLSKDNTFTPALLVIDMQNDFVNGTLAVPDAASIIDPINDMITLPFKVKIATRDFHPGNHVSFAETHQKPLFSTATIYHPDDPDQIKGLMQVLWPIHCVADTSGADFTPGLKSTSFDAVVHKGTHPNIESYSAFRDIWHRGESELPQLLRENQVTDVFIVGLAGDYCVKYTALDSVDFGYTTWVVKDAVRSISKEEVAWEEMRKKGVQFTNKKETMERLGSS